MSQPCCWTHVSHPSHYASSAIISFRLWQNYTAFFCFHRRVLCFWLAMHISNSLLCIRLEYETACNGEKHDCNLLQNKSSVAANIHPHTSSSGAFVVTPTCQRASTNTLNEPLWWRWEKSRIVSLSDGTKCFVWNPDSSINSRYFEMNMNGPTIKSETITGLKTWCLLITPKPLINSGRTGVAENDLDVL